MHTAAHPDDEDTALIARAARGDHARVAYLSLNRGEGGQNIIGPELFDALGVIRTEELLQARTLDGGDQFFTRAFDFGFTKTMGEAAEKWDEARIVGDMVRAIRRYRPLVVLAGFSGTPADGHGQHQLAGRLTPIAFEAAADPLRFPEQIAEGLRPWQPKKLYVRQGFRPRPGDEASLRLPTGIYDPLLGRSYFEIAMEGRSQHKSQEMGVVEARGAKTSNLRLLKDLTGRPAGAEETSIFDGLDVTLRGLARLAGAPDGVLARELTAADEALAAALASPDLVARPASTVPHISRALEAVRAASQALASAQLSEAVRAEAAFLLTHEEAELEDALLRAAGVVVDALSDREAVAAGERFTVSVNVFRPAGSPASTDRVDLRLPPAWTSGPAGAPADPAPENPFARFFREEPDASTRFEVTVAGDAAPTEPYWLVRPRTGPVFTWEDVPLGEQGLPFAPPLVMADLQLTIGGSRIRVSRPVEYRYADAVRGEIRRRLAVVPAVTVAFDEPLLVLPARSPAPRRVAVRLHSQTLGAGVGRVRLIVPDGWRAEPSELPVHVAARGERQAVALSVAPPAGVAPGAYVLRAEASFGDRIFRSAMQVIDYPHIQKHRLYEPAVSTARVLDLAVAQVRVGYVMGGSDQVPEAIRRMGLDVTLLTDDQLASADLSRFDTIVVGIRASEARPAFVANNGRLLQYARDGGTLIVQYQQTDYTARRLAPFPGEGSARVTDERAPVRLLQPAHPVFTFPNRITTEDWADWVQERNLYAFASFDPQYVPLLETADPGEPPQRGGQLYARLGKGHYVYTSYAWFRQLPAGVPGAYRLFANLLSLSRAPATGDGGSRPL
jgi:LmbE family N-acetylglucosaminyl deacetylase